MIIRSVHACLLMMMFGLANAVNAAPALASGAPGSFMLPAFELSYLNANQGSGDNTSSALLSWVPSYRFTSMFALRANVGVSALRGHNPQDKQMTFAMYDFEILARLYIFDNFDVEAGGGIQNWVQQGGAMAAYSINVGYHPTQPLLGFIDRFFVGYTNVDQSTNVSEFRAGLGASF